MNLMRTPRVSTERSTEYVVRLGPPAARRRHGLAARPVAAPLTPQESIALHKSTQSPSLRNKRHGKSATESRGADGRAVACKFYPNPPRAHLTAPLLSDFIKRLEHACQTIPIPTFVAAL